jgi:hypothetical protein
MAKLNPKYTSFAHFVREGVVGWFDIGCEFRETIRNEIVWLDFFFTKTSKEKQIISIDTKDLGTKHIATNLADVNLIGKCFDDIKIFLPYVWTSVNASTRTYAQVPKDPKLYLCDGRDIMPKGFWIMYPKAGFRFLPKYRRIMENEISEIKNKVLSIIIEKLDVALTEIDF